MKTIYIKIVNDAGAAVAAEELTPPVYVCKQEGNGQIVRCVETQAQGVLDAEGANIYQLYGKEPIDRAVANAVVITAAEYEELLPTLGTTDEDKEDTEPEVPEGAAGEVMTRAELTAAVNQLAADQAALTAAIQKGLTL